jgi:hypothetical protein
VNYWAFGLVTSLATIIGTIISRLVWLAGLRHVLRDSHPRSRAQIPRAYGSCQPILPSFIVRRGQEVAKDAKKD